MKEYKLIDKIKSPDCLKKMTIKEMEALASEIREFIIDKVSHTGGHLSANLGVVEATIAMHYVFDMPNDKIIFDVGHQGYVHKILTGRAKDFDNLRKFNGLSGFLKSSESPYDVFEAGHSSTSISAMCGFLEEKKTNPDIGEVVSFIGDGSFQNGLALSAINYLGSKNKSKGIIILNDNDMSISKNVGGLAKYFNKVRIRKSFSFLRKITPVSFKNTIKAIAYRNTNYFFPLGVTYIGPVDGHDIQDLIKYFTYAKKNSSSIIIHIKTIKGKGYKFAEEDREGKYHGLGPFDMVTGEVLNKPSENEISFSNAIGSIIPEFLDKYSNIKLLSPAMIYGTGLEAVSKAYPNRIIDVGICEENAVVMASAMAICKTVPFVCTYSTFIQRAYDEINHDISRTDKHVVFLLDRAGIVPGDGNTHQGIFDLTMFLPLPNFICTAPATKEEAKELIEIAINTPHPFVIRYPKVRIKNDITSSKTEFGKWKIIKNIRDKNIITYGPTLYEFKSLLEGKNVGLINALFIKPLDINLLKQLKGTKVYVYEEVIKECSLGSEIVNINYEYKLDLEIIRYGLDVFTNEGKLDEIRDANGLNINKIVNEIIGE